MTSQVYGLWCHQDLWYSGATRQDDKYHNDMLVRLMKCVLSDEDCILVHQRQTSIISMIVDRHCVKCYWWWQISVGPCLPKATLMRIHDTACDRLILLIYPIWLDIIDNHWELCEGLIIIRSHMILNPLTALTNIEEQLLITFASSLFPNAPTCLYFTNWTDWIDFQQLYVEFHKHAPQLSAGQPTPSCCIFD